MNAKHLLPLLILLPWLPSPILAGEAPRVLLPVGAMTPVQAWWYHYPERLVGWDYQKPRLDHQLVPVYASHPVQWVMPVSQVVAAPRMMATPQVMAAPVYYYTVVPAHLATAGR